MSPGEWQHREPVRGRRGFLTLAVFLAALVAGRTAGARTAGSLDPTFGAGGVVVRDLPGAGDAFDAVAVDGDGRVLVSGPGGVTRLDPAGVPDPTFVAGDVRGRLTIQPDGRVVVLGPAGPSRLHADGTSDTGFGQDGTAVLPAAFRSPGAELTAFARQPNGKLVVGGVVGNQFALARWDSRGDLDRGFGADGLVVTPAAPGGSRVEAVVATPDNGLLVAGSGRFDQPVASMRFVVARYLSDGRLDSSFGSGGIVTTDLGGAASATSVVRQADGRVVAGGLDRGLAGDLLLARYRDDGVLDQSFGSGGIVVTDPGGAPDPAAAVALALAPGGAILAARTGGAADACGVVLLRHRPDGSLDPAFGIAGAARDDTGSCDVTLALAFAGDGRIVTAGVRKGSRGRRGLVERRFGGACGDGVRDLGEDCDGPGCASSCCVADGDGDGHCDAVDPCTGPSAVERLRLQASRGRAGRMLGGKLLVSGEVVLPAPADPALDPVAHGFRLVAGNALDVTLPPGAYDSAAKRGWLAASAGTSRRWTYRDGSGVPSDGITRVVLREVTNDGVHVIRLAVQSGPGRWEELIAHADMVVTLVLDPDHSPRRQCGALAFGHPPDAPSCRLKRNGAGISCR